MNLAILLLPLLFFFVVTIQSSFSANNDRHYFEVTRPLPTDTISPACSMVGVLDYAFRNTSQVTVDLIPPPETCNWSRAVLEFRPECELGDQMYERIVGVWIDGVEILRTSTPQPRDSRIFWNVRKDVTRYSSVIRRNNNNHTLSVMIENNVHDDFAGGVYHINISLLFYSSKHVRVSEAPRLNIYVEPLENEPADLIIPISGAVDQGCWFRIQNETDVLTKNVRISSKTYKVVLELYVSSHGDDGFWYINPSDSYIEANDLTTTAAHGGYREVLVTIDGKLVGSVIPFPVIFSSGIHPLFWEPVVSIGAFDLPSYVIDLTTFLGFLSDNKPHSIGLQVADGISFWLVDANLHLWLDHNSNVKSQILEFKVPSMDVRRKNKFKMLDGIFDLEGERESKVKVLINSSFCNLKIKHTFKTKFKSRLKIKDQGG